MHKHCPKMPHTISYDEYFNICDNILVCKHKPHKPCPPEKVCKPDDGFVYPHVPEKHDHKHIYPEFPFRPLMDIDGDGFVEATFILKPF